MSNSGNKGVFSNNIGSSVGGFTKRNSGDAGSAGGTGSTAERRRVSGQDSPFFVYSTSPLSCPTSQSAFLNLDINHRYSPTFTLDCFLIVSS